MKKNSYSKPYKECHILLIAYIILFVLWLPYPFFGQQGHWLIHDGLDSLYVWYEVIIPQYVFSGNNTLIPQYMDVPRSSFPTELNLSMLLAWVFTPFYGYIVERLLIPVIAFTGMYLILRKYIIPPSESRQNQLLSLCTSILFAMLPYWPYAGISIAGLPLLLYAFLNIYSEKSKWSDWLIAGLFPFYSSLMFSGFFFLLLLFCYLIYDLLKTKKINWKNWLFISLISILYIVSHYRYFTSFLLDNSFTSHRSEWNWDYFTLSDKEILFETIKTLLVGQYHAASLHTFFILPTIAVGGFILLFKKNIYERKLFIGMVLLLLFTSLFYSACQWNRSLFLLNHIYKVIPIQLQRMHWLQPPLWFFLFALSLKIIAEKFQHYGKYILFALLFGQGIFTLNKHELVININQPSYQAFFAENQFLQIRNYIGKPPKEYRVVSFGLHPNIAIHNGFYSLDGYLQSYPLNYKHEFRKIIESELSKNEKLANYYDFWGSRVYIFSRYDVGYMNRKEHKKNIDRLQLDINTLKQMNGQYIISAIELNPELNPEYRLLKKFSDTDSAWDIYLYEIL